ncbi:MAG: aldo/keto reductase [Aggregatilineales bacterium]
MKYGTINGLEKPVSRLIQGTARFTELGDEDSFALMDASLEAGLTTFDSARHYGNSELIIARWMQARGISPEQLVLLTKGAHPVAGVTRVTPKDITTDLMESLERLNVDVIDLYVLHRDDPDVPVGEIVDVLNEHHRAGRIKAFGGSNWMVERVQAANAYATEHNLTPFTMSSPNYSLAEQVKPPWEGCISISGEQNADARAWYAAQNMALITWSSGAGGFFSGRFTRDNLDTFSSDWDAVAILAYAYEANFQRLERAQKMATEKGVTVFQIALAYVMNQVNLNIFAITGGCTAAEIQANVTALELTLSPEECSWLNTGA